jgi:hypothetical protein
MIFSIEYKLILYGMSIEEPELKTIEDNILNGINSKQADFSLHLERINTNYADQRAITRCSICNKSMEVKDFKPENQYYYSECFKQRVKEVKC